MSSCIYCHVGTVGACVPPRRMCFPHDQKWAYSKNGQHIAIDRLIGHFGIQRDRQRTSCERHSKRRRLCTRAAAMG